MLSSPFPHRLLLALAVLGWAAAIAGFVYARLFASEVAPPRAVMSAQTFAGVVAVAAGLLLTAVAFAGSLVALLFSSQQSGTLLLAGIVSGAYVLPVAALLIHATYLK
ncbi:hypothetical protein [Marilutibacter chinensis]|uniref:Transmembrane protein n=1 Tax=Marilutibacter chinensis TaxID=2912247 RepID=A0ABS9HY39_9GAMM|nr:hypothetical protein [Lysobacter chinensis]MCF7222937.1 hypothetical protein [Lysobacter chinensis]